MLYNKDLKRVQTRKDCFLCPYYDKIKKRCNGLGIACFEQDKFGNLKDPHTNLMIKKEIIEK